VSAGAIVGQPAFGSAILDRRDPLRSVFVLGALARPIAVRTCPDRASDEFASPAEVFLAIVQRAP
jgi:hypothetical protein